MLFVLSLRRRPKGVIAGDGFAATLGVRGAARLAPFADREDIPGWRDVVLPPLSYGGIVGVVVGVGVKEAGADADEVGDGVGDGFARAAVAG